MALLSLADAREFVLAGCRPLPAVTLPLIEARSAVAAEPVVAAESVPPFANSAMDGYAVRAADVAGATDESPARLRVVATTLAGAAPAVAVRAGEAVRIMTGAPMPEGADAVVMVERTVAEHDGTAVAVLHAVEPGANVRGAGDDLRPGDEVIAAGDPLTPARLGVLATVGHDPVRVVPRPRVGVFSTGDELVTGGGPLGPGQIRDSNRPMLLALLADSGFDTIDLGCIPDDHQAISAALQTGVDRCDALVTSGGVSMGDVDLVKVVLDEMGDMRWMQVAIRPAKPLAFGTVTRAIDGWPVPVFGLPGNPVSSAVSFELFARPGLRRMAGHHDLDRLTVTAVADGALHRRPDGKVVFARVACRYGEDGLFHVRLAGGQGSHQLSALAHAEGLAVLPDGEGVAPGGTVSVMLLH